MDDLTALREAWGQAAPPAPAARAAARAALLQQIAGAGVPGRELRPAEPGRRPSPAGRGRPWRLLVTGAIAVTAAAAAAAALLVASPASRPQRAPSPATAAPQSARSFLLASAVKAASAPAVTGAYWYVRERDFEPTIPVTKTRKTFLPGITFAETQESWEGRNRSRTIVDEKVSFSFASPAVKARWRAMGKPPLETASGTSTSPATSNYAMTFRYGPGTGLTMAEVVRLPTTAARLSATLRRMWNSIPAGGGTDTRPDKAGAVGLPDATFTDYVFAWASALLSGPATPGTKAAVYQLLAGQPRMTIIDSVTDPLGRTGVAIADGQGYGGRDYMIIDRQTAQLLAYTTSPVHANRTISIALGGVEVYEATGWTNRLGIPPQS